MSIALEQKVKDLEQRIADLELQVKTCDSYIRQVVEDLAKPKPLTLPKR